MVVATLGPSHHQAWVQHVTFPFLLLRTPVDVGAPAVDPFPIQRNGGVNRHCVGLQGPGLGALTLDLPTLGIPEPGKKTGSKAGEELGQPRAPVLTKLAGTGRVSQSLLHIFHELYYHPLSILACKA